MSRNPEAVQADAFGLSQEERIRLAYRLLKSLSTDATPGAMLDAEHHQPPVPVAIPDLSPPPLAPSFAGRPTNTEHAASAAVTSADPYADWEVESPKATPERPRGKPDPSVVYVRLALPEWLSRGLVATSLVGGAAALFTLGVLFQRRESAAGGALEPRVAVIPHDPLVTFREIPTIAPSSETNAIQTDSSAASLSPAPSSATSERPARIEAAPPISKIPAIPTLAAALIVPDTAAMNPAPPLVIPPAPPRPGTPEISPPAVFGPRQLRDPSAINAAALFASNRVESSEPAPRTTGAPDRPMGPSFDKAPQVRNSSLVQQALEREYPSSLRAWGITGRAEMLFYINEQGVVDSVELKKTSGNRSLDQAAMRVANVFEFTPGLRGQEPVAGWVALEIVFSGS